MPTGDYKRIETYDLIQLEQDILNDKLFGFMKVDLETPEHLKEYFEEMTPVFKNTIVNYEDMGEKILLLLSQKTNWFIFWKGYKKDFMKSQAIELIILNM